MAQPEVSERERHLDRRRTSFRHGLAAPERFLVSGSYEVRREWLRYEGTPQRELIREVRAQFLGRAMERTRRQSALALEIGPGPGRFTPIVARGAHQLVLVDVSMAMLREARRRLRKAVLAPHDHLVDPVRADASKLPFRDSSVDLVVAMGNVAGFAGDRYIAVLEEILQVVRPGGSVVLETMDRLTRIPRFIERMNLYSWVRVLEGNPATSLPILLRQGFLTIPSSPSGPSKSTGFRFLDTKELSEFLMDSGFDIRDQLVAAPLTGGDPSLVEGIVRDGGGRMERLLRWENHAGRLAQFVESGGHTLTLAIRH